MAAFSQRIFNCLCSVLFGFINAGGSTTLTEYLFGKAIPPRRMVSCIKSMFDGGISNSAIYFLFPTRDFLIVFHDSRYIFDLFA